MLVAFLFEPTSKGLSCYPECTSNTSHRRPLKVGFQNLCFPLLTIPSSRIQSTVLVTAFAMIFLLAVVYVMAIADQLCTATIRTRFDKHDHTFGSAFTLIYQTHASVLTLPPPFINRAPGTTYQYTNLGAALAAYLIEIKTGVSFADYSENAIFKPLHLTDSRWFYDAALEPAYATLYKVNREAYPPYSLITYPDGGLRTSCQDLSRYMVEMLKGCAGKSSLLTPQSFKTMFTAQFDSSNMPQQMDQSEPNRAVFWAFNRSGRLVHSGGDPGLSAFVSFDPEN